jgi:hypothetical protein
MRKIIETTDPEYWRLLAKNRFNKELNMKDIHSREDYQYQLKEFLLKNKWGNNIINAGQNKYYSDGRKNPNYKKINYRQIQEAMYEASKEEIIPERKRRFLSLYQLYEAEYTHVSKKGKVYTQKQYQDINGKFTKNPFK